MTTLSLGQSTTRPFRLTNAGAASTVYSMTEQYVSAPALPVYQPTAVGSAPAAINGKGFSVNAQASTGTENQAPIVLAPTAISLTHSLSQIITALNSVSCSATGIHADNHYLRVFDLPTFGISGGLNVTAVQVGIETATAGTGSTQPVQVKLYTLTGAFTFANLTQIGSADVQVSNQTQTILNVPIIASVPAGSKLVVDFFTPDGAVSGHSLYVGSNSLGQTGPTYIAAADCGISEPTDVSSIGFPEMMLVMNVIADGSAGSVDVAWLSEIPVTGTVAADSFLNTTIGFDASVVAVPGTYKANVNVNSFDPENPARTANMTMNVTASGKQGVITGTVSSLGRCDVNPAPAAGATVVLQAANGLTHHHHRRERRLLAVARLVGQPVHVDRDRTAAYRFGPGGRPHGRSVGRGYSRPGGQSALTPGVRELRADEFERDRTVEGEHHPNPDVEQYGCGGLAVYHHGKSPAASSRCGQSAVRNSVRHDLQ